MIYIDLLPSSERMERYDVSASGFLPLGSWPDVATRHLSDFLYSCETPCDRSEMMGLRSGVGAAWSCGGDDAADRAVYWSSPWPWCATERLRVFGQVLQAMTDGYDEGF